MPAPEPDSTAAAPEKPSSLGRMFLKVSGLPFVLSQADDQPVGVRQFLQLCLIVLYPAWLVLMATVALIYGILWVLLWPLHSRSRGPVG
ncbi:hypothetical protein [Nocardia aurantiaca]|uniref:Uncharacterized protein n=1 Tax=Nocardia aurantiaca TaxID=2675850 RepID=A0A6I3L138_9NOCA|nr:hypothetical protein [Nocardia aurantiaca]MTE14510.1 hypothetical protein [Nocardia aurantiaca]